MYNEIGRVNMKKHNSFKVVLITIFVVALCSWIFPSAQFSTQLIEGERVQAGLFDVFSYPMVALYYFMNIFVFVIACGAFYGVAYRIPAYKKLLEKITAGFKGRENIFLVLMIVLIAALVSVTGISFPIVFIFPLVISIILMMGYNKLVAASVTVGSTIVGIAGTTLGTTTVGYVNYILGTDTFDEMITKVIILVILTVLLVANVLLYAKKTKRVVEEKKEELISDDDSDEVKNAKKEESVKTVSTKDDVKKETGKKKEAEKNTKTTKSSKAKTSNRGRKPNSTKGKTRASFAKSSDEVIQVEVANSKPKKVRVWPFVIIFDLIVIILAMSMFDWEGLFEITWFSDATDAIVGYEIGEFPIFAKLLGTFNAFGSWSLNVEVPAMILIFTCILALVYRVKWSDFIDGVVDGAKRSAPVATVMLLIFTVLILVTYHPFQLCITKALLEVSTGLNVVTMSIIAMFASFFNADLTYVAQSTLPYVTSVITDSSLYPLLAVIFQSIYGLMMLIAPTSIILLGTLTYLDVPYTQWLKHIWKLFLQFLIVLVIIFLIVLAV